MDFVRIENQRSSPTSRVIEATMATRMAGRIATMENSADHSDVQFGCGLAPAPRPEQGSDFEEYQRHQADDENKVDHDSGEDHLVHRLDRGQSEKDSKGYQGTQECRDDERNAGKREQVAASRRVSFTGPRTGPAGSMGEPAASRRFWVMPVSAGPVAVSIAMCCVPSQLRSNPTVANKQQNVAKMQLQAQRVKRCRWRSGKSDRTR
jgi:hypothetical protein